MPHFVPAQKDGTVQESAEMNTALGKVRQSRRAEERQKRKAARVTEDRTPLVMLGGRKYIPPPPQETEEGFKQASSFWSVVTGTFMWEWSVTRCL